MKCYELLDDLENEVPGPEKQKVFDLKRKIEESEPELDASTLAFNLSSALQDWAQKRYDTAIPATADVIRTIHQEFMKNSDYKKNVVFFKSFLRGMDLPPIVSLFIQGLGIGA